MSNLIRFCRVAFDPIGNRRIICNRSVEGLRDRFQRGGTERIVSALEYSVPKPAGVIRAPWQPRRRRSPFFKPSFIGRNQLPLSRNMKS